MSVPMYHYDTHEWLSHYCPLQSPWHIEIVVYSPAELSGNRGNGSLLPFLASPSSLQRGGGPWDLQEVDEVNVPSPKGPPLTQSLTGEVYVS